MDVHPGGLCPRHGQRHASGADRERRAKALGTAIGWIGQLVPGLATGESIEAHAGVEEQHGGFAPDAVDAMRVVVEDKQ